MIAPSREQLRWFYRVLLGRLPRALDRVWLPKPAGQFFTLDEVRRRTRVGLFALLALGACHPHVTEPVSNETPVDPSWTYCDLETLPACDRNNECMVVDVVRGTMTRPTCVPRGPSAVAKESP